MLDAWTWPAYVGIGFGVAFFAVAFVPVVVLQSRLYGRVPRARLLAAAALAVYLTVLAFYTLFPLPSPDWCSVNVPPPAQLTPLHSVGEIRDAVQATSLGQAARSVVVLQVVFNVLLFVPFGVMLRSVLELGRVTTVLCGLATSLLIETIQGTGIFGIIGCAYRVADVDDLLTNTLGTAVGVALAPLLAGWLPARRSLERARQEPRAVTRLRRLAGMLVDGFLVVVTTTVLTIAYRCVVHFGLGRPVPDGRDWLDSFAPAVVAFAVVALPCVIGTGASPGQRALWLRPVDASRWLLAWRSLVGIGGWALLSVVSVAPPLLDTAWASGADRAAGIMALVALVWLAVDRTGRGMSFRLSGLAVVDARDDGPA